MVIKQEKYENALDVLFNIIHYNDTNIYLTQCKLDVDSIPYDWHVYEVLLHRENQDVDIVPRDPSCESVYSTVLSPVQLCFPIHLSNEELTRALHEGIALYSVLDDLIEV